MKHHDLSTNLTDMWFKHKINVVIELKHVLLYFKNYYAV